MKHIKGILPFWFKIQIILIFLVLSGENAFSSVVDKYSDHLLVYYSFEGQKGSVLKDKSGRSNHAAISGTKDFWSPLGVFGGAGQFRKGTRVLVNSSRRLAKGDEMTIMMWVKPSNLDGRKKLLSKRSYEKEFNYFVLGLDKGRPFGGLGDGEEFGATPRKTAIESGEWVHLCVTFDNAKHLRFFINGKQIEAVQPEVQGYNTLRSQMSIGSDFEGSEGYFEGLVDELMFVNKAVAPHDILAEVNRSQILFTKNLSPEKILEDPKRFQICYLPIHEGRGSRVANISSPKNHGRLSSGLESRWQESFIQNSLLFNGEDDLISVPTYPKLDIRRSFSLLAWVRPFRFGERTKIIYKAFPSDPYRFFTIGEDKGVLYGGIGNGEEVDITPKKTKLELNKWQQIGLIFGFEEKVLKLVKNGQVVETASTKSFPFTGESPLYIGGEGGKPKRYFSGEISQVRLYNVEIPNALVASLYQEKVKEIAEKAKIQAKKAKVRAELKEALRELEEINQVLGSEKVVEVSKGKEREALQKVRELIKKQLVILEKRKQSELENLKSLIREVTQKIKELNGMLKALGQPLIEEKLPVPNASMDVRAISKISATMTRKKVEIELLLKEKKSELDLKKRLEKRKKARLQKTVNEEVKRLNTLNAELDQQAFQIDTSKVQGDVAAYLKEIRSLIEKREKMRDANLAKLKEAILKTRTEIRNLNNQMADLSKMIGKGDTTFKDSFKSLTTTSIKALEKIRKADDLILAKRKERLKGLEKAAESFRQKSFKELLDACKRYETKLGKLNNYYKQLGLAENKSFPKAEKKLSQEIRLVNIREKLRKYEKLERRVDEEIFSKQSEVAAKKKKEQAIILRDLKKEFKFVRNRLLLINAELEISEKWSIDNRVKGKGDGKSLIPDWYFNFDKPNVPILKEVRNGIGFLKLNDFDRSNFVEGHYGKALGFDGKNHFADLDLKPFIKGAKTFSLGFWFYVEKNNQDETLFTMTGESSDKKDLISAQINGKRLLVFESRPSGTNRELAEKQDLENKKWHHLVFVVDRENKRGRIFFGNKLLSDRRLFTRDSITSMRFGRAFKGALSYKGAIDDLKLFKRPIKEDEVNKVSEKWALPEEGNFSEVERIKAKIDKMQKLIDERKAEVDRRRKEEKEKRQKLLSQLKTKVNALNEKLRILGLPEYPEPDPKKGQEQKLLQKFEAELKERTLQVEQQKERMERQRKELENNWKGAISELNDLGKILGLPEEKSKFLLANAEQDISRFRRLIKQRRSKVQEKQEKEKSRIKVTILNERSKKVNERNIKESSVRAVFGQVQALRAQLGQTKSGKINLPWLKKPLSQCISYFSFDQEKSFQMTEMAERHLFELIGYERLAFEEGKFGKALGFDGIRQYAKSEFLSFGSSGFVLSFWAKNAGILKGQTILNLVSGSSDNVLLELEKGLVELSYDIGGILKEFNTGVALPKGKWVHVALTLDPQSKKSILHLNGKLAWDRRLFRALPEWTEFYLGAGQGGKDYFKGVIDELKILNLPLSNEFYTRLGSENKWFSLENQSKYLSEEEKKLKDELNQLKNKVKQVELEKRRKTEQLKAKLIDELNILNEFHKKLGEREEKLEDFDVFAEDTRFTIIQSRTRRAKRRYQEFQTAEAEQREFAKAAAEIDSIWEQMAMMVKELGLKMNKPNYTKENVSQVLSKLKRDFDSINQKYQAFKNEQERNYQTNKQELEKQFNLLKDILSELNEPIAFNPDYSREGVNGSLKNIKKLLAGKNALLKEKKAKEAKQLLRQIQLDLRKLGSIQSELFSMSKKLGQAKALPKRVAGVFSDRPESMLFALLMDQIINGKLGDWYQNPRFSLTQAELVVDEGIKAPKVISFNGVSSRGALALLPQEQSINELLLSFSLNASRRWNERTILSIPMGKNEYLSLGIQRSQIFLKYIRNGSEITRTGISEINLGQWEMIAIHLNQAEGKATLYRGEPKDRKSLVGSLSYAKKSKVGSSIAFGSTPSKGDFFAGSISNIKLFKGNGRDLPNGYMVKYSEPQFTSTAAKKVKDFIQSETLKLQTLKKDYELFKEKQKKQREQVLSEIEKLKKELSRYTGKDKIIFSVVIGKEEEALQKLKVKVQKAKETYERKLAEQKKLRGELLSKIKDHEAKISKISQELGIAMPKFKVPKEGQEKLYLDDLKNRFDQLEKQKQEKIIQEKAKKQKVQLEIQKLKAKLQELSLQLNIPKEKIQFPSASLKPEAYLGELKKRVKQTSDSLEKKRLEEQKLQHEQMLTKWTAQYKVLKSISAKMGAKPPLIEPPKPGAEIEALSTLADLISEAKKKLKAIQMEKKKKIGILQNEFERISGQLKPLLKELGSKKISKEAFDSSDLASAKNSVEKIKLLLQEAQKDLRAKKKAEETRLKKLKKTAEGLHEAIEEEKVKVKGFAKELGISNYKLPTSFGGGAQGAKELAGYYKFDSLKSKSLLDETKNSKKSFILPYNADVKSVGKFGFAATLNGLDNYINLDLPWIEETKALTIALWVNPRRGYGERVCFTSVDEETNNSISCYSKDYFLGTKGSIEGKPFEFMTETSIPKKKWSHIAMSLDEKGALSLFFDGKTVLTQKLNIAMSKLVGKKLVLGSAFNKAENLFSGMVDEFKLYTVAMSEKDLRKVMEEEEVISKIMDVGLLEEELRLLKGEAKKLDQKIKQQDEAREQERLAKVEEIKGLIDSISEIQANMGQSLFEFPYESDKEDAAIRELKKIKREKEAQFKQFKAEKEKQTEAYRRKAKELQEKIAKIEKEMGKEVPFRVVLREGLEKEVIDGAESHLKRLEDEYAAFVKMTEEKRKLEIRNKLLKAVDSLNRLLLKLDEKPVELEAIEEKDDLVTLQKVNKLVQEKEKEILRRKSEEEKARERAQEELEKSKLLGQAKTLTRERRSLLRALGLTDSQDIDGGQVDSSLRVYLDFNEGRGRLLRDQSKYGNRASFPYLDFEWVDTGIYNKAVQLNGDSGKLQIESSPSLNEIGSFTLMVWINPERLYGTRQIVSVGKTEVPSFQVMLQNELLILGLGKGLKVDTGVGVKKNVWQNIALTFDNNNKLARLFIDANPVAEVEFNSSEPFASKEIFIGSDGIKEYFAGRIDEFKLFSRVLGENEINENLNEGVSKVDVGLESLKIGELKTKNTRMEEEIKVLREKKIQLEKRKLENQRRRSQENKLLRNARELMLKNDLKNYKAAFDKLNLKLSGEERIDFPAIKDLTDETMDEVKERYSELHDKVHRFGSKERIIDPSPVGDLLRENLLFSHITFEDYSGQEAKDISGKGHPTKISAGNLDGLVAEGVKGNAIRLDGQQFLKIKNNQNVSYDSRQSFQVWIQPQEESLNHSNIWQRGSIELEIFKGQLRIINNDEVIPFSGLGRIQAGKWYWVCVVLDEFSSKIKVSLGQTEGIVQSYNSAVSDPSGTIYLGGSPSSPKRFKGLIDEIKVFHRALQSRDFIQPFITNVDLSGNFCPQSFSAVSMKVQATGAEYMRVYQEGSEREATWELFRGKKILIVSKPRQKRKRTITVVAEFKNRFSDKVYEERAEVDIPRSLAEPIMVLPLKNVEVTTS